jgi:hypothetical protein
LQEKHNITDDEFDRLECVLTPVIEFLGTEAYRDLSEYLIEEALNK